MKVKKNVRINIPTTCYKSFPRTYLLFNLDIIEYRNTNS